MEQIKTNEKRKEKKETTDKRKKREENKKNKTMSRSKMKLYIGIER